MKEPVVHAASVRGKELWGFTNNEECVFVKLDFHTLKEMKDQERILKRTYQVYESNIDPVLRFMHRTNISSTGWLDSGPECERAYISTCDIDLWCNNWKTLTPVSRDDIAPLRIMSFDIEAYSHDGGFPDPEHPDNVVFQIGMTIKVYGQEGWFDRKCLCLKQTDSQDCESFEKEEDLLEEFAKYLIKTDPDIITGYNIFGFDLEFLMKRMRILPVTPTACFWTRLKNRSVQLVEKTLSSSALGSNQLKMVPMAGRYVFDLFQDIKREHKLESYSLNSVSKHFLKDQKNDMPVREIFRRYMDGDPSELGEVAAYCIKDTELPHALMKKLFTIENLIEMAKATWVPLSYLSERGQQIKVYSQLSRKARELGFMIPVMQIKGTDDKYQGATVLEAQTGAYYGPITALDFASLYPSIMCAHNLCYSTMVMNPKYDNLPGVTYEQFGQYRFAQTLRAEGGTILPVPSLLPAILTELKQFRKKAKKLMAQSEGTPMYGVYNGQQLAYKISMNSVYGFTGASKGMLPLLAIASTVTMRGRQMIEETKNYVEAHFHGAKVRYGDSVMPGTPVLVRGPYGIRIQTIESLADHWTDYPGFLKEGKDKEQSELESLEVWTHRQWQPIKRVIRHKCQKKIYRVLTHTGLVDVTEDHSLLDKDLNLLKPKDVQVCQKLYHSFPESLEFDEACSIEEAFILGVFVGDGSCVSYDCPSGQKSTWAINNKDLKLLEKCKVYCERIHTGYDFVIMDTLESSGVYKLSPRGGSVIDLVKLYREKCYDGQAKKVPIKAFGQNAQAFLDGLWASDGCRKDAETIGCHRIDTKNQVTAQWYYLFLRHMGCFNVSINTRTDKPNVFRLTWTKGPQRKDPEAIKKIDVLHESWDGYVYDLETDAGTFQAGIGRMIVKNTDSVMVEFDVGGRTGQEAIDYSWQLGEQASEQCTKLFKEPNELELEKIYCPYFLYSKKRYAAKMYEKKGDDVVFKKIDVKGLQVVRRDNCPYVREVCKDILETILETSDPLPSIEKARKAAKDLKAGLVPMEKLMMSKQLASEYKSKSIAHVAVVEKMRERVPGSEPKQGDRVPFVIVQGPKNAKMFERAEDPQYVREHNLNLDLDYYFENQLKNPVCDLLEPLVGDTRVIFEKPVRKITDFFSK
jgi:DNA polymerase elongation subunit (family B)